MLRQAIDDLDDEDGVYVRHHLDDRLMNLRCLQANTNIQEKPTWDFLFAYDAPLVASMVRALQHMASCFAGILWLFGLKVSLWKACSLLTCS